MVEVLKNWHFMRVLRAGIALWIFVEVWRTGEWLLLIAGVIFALQAIFDLGCGGAAGCGMPAPRKNPLDSSKPDTPIIYEEVK